MTHITRVASSYGAGKKAQQDRVAYPPNFYMHLKNPHAHWKMIEGLKNRYRMEECIFNIIFGKFEGHKILAIRKGAEKIEIQTR